MRASLVFVSTSLLMACVHPPPSEDALRHNALGVELLVDGRLAEARAHLTLALEYRPRFAEARVNLGVIALEEGRLVEAEALFRRSIRDAPDLALAHGNLGVSLERQGRLRDAERAYRAALRVDPASYEARANLARRLVERGEVRAALEELRRLEAQRPEDEGVRDAREALSVRVMHER